MKKWLVVVLIILVIVLLGALYVLFPSYPPEEEIGVGERFRFVGEFENSVSLFNGVSAIDVNGDGYDELFVSGENGRDMIYSFGEDMRVVNEFENAGETRAALSIDFDGNGFSDLLLSKKDRLVLLMNDGVIFESKDIELNLESHADVFSSSVGDIDNDGDLDIYVSTFIDEDNFMSLTFNDVDHRTKNLLLLNRGDLVFEDISDASGSGFSQNTFASAFVDLDSDGFLDIVVSPNTDRIRLYKNNGDLTFNEHIPFKGYGTWMGIGINDIDNDNDPDLILSNFGNFLDSGFLRGDLNEDQELYSNWALFENNGNFEFELVNEEYGLRDYEFAWGMLFGDYLLDGKIDLIVSTNYVKWFVHKIYKSNARFFSLDDGKYVPIGNEIGVDNKRFGQSPLTFDSNRDNLPDLLFANIKSNHRLFENINNENNFVVVRLPDNSKYISAKVVVSDNGKDYVQYYTPGLGLNVDSAPELYFGLEGSENVEVVVEMVDGEVLKFKDVKVNEKLIVS